MPTRATTKQNDINNVIYYCIVTGYSDDSGQPIQESASAVFTYGSSSVSSSTNYKLSADLYSSTSKTGYQTYLGDFSTVSIPLVSDGYRSVPTPITAFSRFQFFHDINSISNGFLNMNDNYTWSIATDPSYPRDASGMPTGNLYIPGSKLASYSGFVLDFGLGVNLVPPGNSNTVEFTAPSDKYYFINNAKLVPV